MKLTKATLKQLIKEEMQKVLQEFDDDDLIPRAWTGEGPGADWMADLMAPALRAKRAKRAEREKRDMAFVAPHDSEEDTQLGGHAIDQHGAARKRLATLLRRVHEPGMTPGKQRLAINAAFKRGEIDKDVWRKLRRKYHKRRQKSKLTPKKFKKAFPTGKINTKKRLAALNRAGPPTETPLEKARTDAHAKREVVGVYDPDAPGGIRRRKK